MEQHMFAAFAVCEAKDEFLHCGDARLVRRHD